MFNIVDHVSCVSLPLAVKTDKHDIINLGQFLTSKLNTFNDTQFEHTTPSRCGQNPTHKTLKKCIELLTRKKKISKRLSITVVSQHRQWLVPLTKKKNVDLNVRDRSYFVRIGERSSIVTWPSYWQQLQHKKPHSKRKLQKAELPKSHLNVVRQLPDLENCVVPFELGCVHSCHSCQATAACPHVLRTVNLNSLWPNTKVTDLLQRGATRALPEDKHKSRFNSVSRQAASHSKVSMVTMMMKEWWVSASVTWSIAYVVNFSCITDCSCLSRIRLGDVTETVISHRIEDQIYQVSQAVSRAAQVDHKAWVPPVITSHEKFSNITDTGQPFCRAHAHSIPNLTLVTAPCHNDPALCAIHAESVSQPMTKKVGTPICSSWYCILSWQSTKASTSPKDRNSVQETFRWVTPSRNHPPFCMEACSAWFSCWVRLATERSLVMMGRTNEAPLKVSQIKVLAFTQFGRTTWLDIVEVQMEQLTPSQSSARVVKTPHHVADRHIPEHKRSRAVQTRGARMRSSLSLPRAGTTNLPSGAHTWLLRAMGSYGTLCPPPLACPIWPFGCFAMEDAHASLGSHMQQARASATWWKHEYVQKWSTD